MKKELLTYKDPKSPISETFRTLRTNIQFMNTDKKLKTLLITSTFPGEGKSWITANLAVTFAQAGKRVILVDADMRKGRQYNIFGVLPKPGLSNYLSNMGADDMETSDINITNYIQETDVENLHILTAGNVPPNPSELLVSHRMKELLKELKTMCDLVIIDGTPCDLVTDSVILSRVVDSTIIITAQKETKKENLTRIVKNIQNVGGKIAGIVVNKVDVSAKKYNQAYYYGSTGSKIKKSSKKDSKKMEELFTNLFKNQDKEDDEEIGLNEKQELDQELKQEVNQEFIQEFNQEEEVNQGIEFNQEMNKEQVVETYTASEFNNNEEVIQNNNIQEDYSQQQYVPEENNYVQEQQINVPEENNYVQEQQINVPEENNYVQEQNNVQKYNEYIQPENNTYEEKDYAKELDKILERNGYIQEQNNIKEQSTFENQYNNESEKQENTVKESNNVYTEIEAKVEEEGKITQVINNDDFDKKTQDIIRQVNEYIEAEKNRQGESYLK